VLEEPRFHFFEGDITINSEWIEYHIRKCDTVLPLVAIATPATYVKEPLRVFELDFEANLPIVRACVRTRSASCSRRPPRSTACRATRVRSRGLAARATADQQAALDLRLLEAAHGPRDLAYGAGRARLHPVPAVQLDRRRPRFDRTPKEGSSRVLTQFLGHIVRGEPIKLVDGGRRSAPSPTSTTASTR
jgi:hypothetical protein